MKIKWLLPCLMAFTLVVFTPKATLTAKAESYKSSYVCDWVTGTQVSGENELCHYPIASMCKIMTLLLSFEAIERNDLNYDTMVKVSEHASSMGGSQVFLDTGLEYPVNDLLKSIAVCSANDSCVAIAETICGSEGVFVDRMNERAKELGANDTLFANCTGLPKETQYSCAKDVALMLREMTKHEKYFEYASTRVEEFHHPDGRSILMTNTNKMMRSFEGMDGGKTGYTAEAGFCLASTAKRGDTRLVSVVIGADSSNERFQVTADILNNGFAKYEYTPVVKAGDEIYKIETTGSKIKEVGVLAKDTMGYFGEKGKKSNIELVFDREEKIKAGAQKGETIGSAKLFVNGVETSVTEVYLSEDVPKYTFWEAFRNGASLFSR